MRYVIWGSAGHARVIASAIALNGGSVIALFDNDPGAKSVLEGVPLYIGREGFERWRAHEPGAATVSGLVAIGGARGRDRREIHDFLRAQGLRVEPLLHAQASVCATASIGAGSQILAQAVVAAGTRVGEACIVNHHATVDHECVLGDGAHLAPAATLCGCVTVGANVMVGAGAIVLPRLKIGNDTIVGAGAVVTRDLPQGVVAAGVPARILRNI